MRDWLTARPIAHRGLHDAASGVIENTPSAFRAAIEGGYGIECDLQISADGEAMVHHDDALGRLTDGAGRLDAMTAAALQRVAFKGTADRMLTLGELCDLVARPHHAADRAEGPFAGDTGSPPAPPRCWPATSGPVAAMSFDPGLMAALRRLAPTLAARPGRRCGATPATPVTARMSRAGATLRQALAARPQFLAYRVQDLATGAAAASRGTCCGWPLLTWTVRTAEDRARAARYADQMIFEGFRP